MPPIPKAGMFSVPEPDVDPIIAEVLVRAQASKQRLARSYDPALGSSYEEAEEQLLRIRGDVGRFGEYVFGLTPARHHQLWNQVADDVINRRVPQNKVLFLAPPNSAKSTWNSLIRPTHYLGQHPDHNLLFFTSSDPMANTFHRTIEAVLRENEKYQLVFPDPANRPDRRRGWSSDGLYLQGTPPISKDGAYRSVGFGASVMGARAHGVIIDDPMNQEQAKSEAEQRKAREYSSQTVMRRLHPDIGWCIAVMTRFHENDLASYYIELAEKEAGWIVVRLPLIATNEPETDPLGRSTGELLWPEYLTPSYVVGEQAEMSIAEFELVHQADVSSQGGDIFERESWFRPLPANFWTEVFSTCRILQFWDLAFSERKQTCFTVGLTAAVDPSLNLYIIHLVRARMNTGQAEEEIVRTIQLTRPMLVGMESDKFHRQTIVAMAVNVMDRVMVNLHLIEPQDDKISRARLPAGRAQAGKLFVDHAAPWYRTFVRECLAFPLSKYKDQVDALSGLAAMVQKMDQLMRSRKVRKVEHVMSA